MGFTETAITAAVFVGAGGAGIWYFDPKATDERRYPNKAYRDMCIFFTILGVVLAIVAAVQGRAWRRDAAAGVASNVTAPAAGTNPGGVNPQGVPAMK